MRTFELKTRSHRRTRADLRVAWRRAFRGTLMAALVGWLVWSPALSAALARAGEQAAAPPYFEFRVSFWLNLNHFLYVLGRARGGVRDAQRAAVAGAPLDTEGFDRLDEADQRAWDGAVDYYQAGPSQRDAVFSEGLIRTNIALARAGDGNDIAAVVEPELAAVLTRVAPIYRRIWWDRHRDGIDRRIAEWNVLIERFGDRAVGRLARLYRLDWTEPVVVEVTAYANWAGAYSTGTDDQSLIVMSALYDGHAGLGGLESALHESLHQGNEVGDRAFELSRERELRLHDWLTHGLIFYTTGEIVHDLAPDHVPNGHAFGVWDRVAPQLPAVFDAHWRPYMNGEMTLDEALLALLRATQ